MSPFVISKPTSVQIGKPDGTWADITGYVKDVQMEQATYDADMNKPVTFLRTQSFTIALRGEIKPRGYRLLFGRTHPRISRMHRAYRTRQLARRRRR